MNRDEKRYRPKTEGEAINLMAAQPIHRVELVMPWWKTRAIFLIGGMPDQVKHAIPESFWPELDSGYLGITCCSTDKQESSAMPSYALTCHIHLLHRDGRKTGCQATTLAHEVLHVCMSICEYLGFATSEHSDETLAHMHSYIFARVFPKLCDFQNERPSINFNLDQPHLTVNERIDMFGIAEDEKEFHPGEALSLNKPAVSTSNPDPRYDIADALMKAHSLLMQEADAASQVPEEHLGYRYDKDGWSIDTQAGNQLSNAASNMQAKRVVGDNVSIVPVRRSGDNATGHGVGAAPAADTSKPESLFTKSPLGRAVTAAGMMVESLQEAKPLLDALPHMPVDEMVAKGLITQEDAAMVEAFMRVANRGFTARMRPDAEPTELFKGEEAPADETSFEAIGHIDSQDMIPLQNAMGEYDHDFETFCGWWEAYTDGKDPELFEQVEASINDMFTSAGKLRSAEHIIETKYPGLYVPADTTGLAGYNTARLLPVEDTKGGDRLSDKPIRITHYDIGKPNTDPTHVRDAHRSELLRNLGFAYAKVINEGYLPRAVMRHIEAAKALLTSVKEMEAFIAQQGQETGQRAEHDHTVSAELVWGQAETTDKPTASVEESGISTSREGLRQHLDTNAATAMEEALVADEMMSRRERPTPAPINPAMLDALVKADTLHSDKVTFAVVYNPGLMVTAVCVYIGAQGFQYVGTAQSPVPQLPLESTAEDAQHLKRDYIQAVKRAALEEAAKKAINVEWSWKINDHYAGD